MYELINFGSKLILIWSCDTKMCVTQGLKAHVLNLMTRSILGCDDSLYLELTLQKRKQGSQASEGNSA